MDLDAIRRRQDFMTGRRDFLVGSVAREAEVQPLVLWEQSLFNYFFSSSNLPMPVHLIPVDRLSGHPREAEWRQLLTAGEYLILDIKGWANQSPQAELFWRFLLETPWRAESKMQLSTLGELEG